MVSCAWSNFRIVAWYILSLSSYSDMKSARSGSSMYMSYSFISWAGRLLRQPHRVEALTRHVQRPQPAHAQEERRVNHRVGWQLSQHAHLAVRLRAEQQRRARPLLLGGAAGPSVCSIRLGSRSMGPYPRQGVLGLSWIRSGPYEYGIICQNRYVFRPADIPRIFAVFVNNILLQKWPIRVWEWLGTIPDLFRLDRSWIISDKHS